MNNTFIGRWRSLTTPLLVVAVVVFGLAIAAQAADAANTGWHNGSVFFNTSGYGENWADPDEAQYDDSDYAEVDLDDWETSEYLVARGFGFSIPNGATINGIWVNVERKAEKQNRIKDYNVQLVKGNFIVGSNKSLSSFWGTSSYDAYYGGSSDLWGTSWSASNVNSSDFGFVLRVKKDTYHDGHVKALVDHIKIKVYYTEANYCGDGQVNQQSEQCDGTDGVPEHYTCTDQCQLEYVPYCGDGQVNQTWEQCDGSAPEHYTCSNECQLEYVPYCGDQEVNQKDEQCDGQEGCTEQCTWKPATVNAQKVICKNESDLPNSGSDRYLSPIDEDTAQDWVDQSAGNCRLAEWNFQIAPGNTANVDNNSGEAGAPWTTFSGSTEVAAYTDKVWLREIWDEDYIPFSGDTTEPRDDVSAEFYCNNDVLNYDNYDWITNLRPDTDYYCVGWNVMKKGTVTFHKDVRWNNDKVDVDDNTAFAVKVDGNYVGDVSENSPLEVELPIGTHFAIEEAPTGFAILNGEAEFSVNWNENTDVYFENKLTCSEGATWAYEAVEFNQGTTNNGGAVAANRSNTLAALGPADGNAVGTFVSLGKAGSLTVKFEHSVMDGTGDDISVHETTNGTYPEETALVEVSYDGSTWYELGTASNLNAGGDSYFDLATVGLPIANYVRLTDTTDFLTNFANDGNADGFDVDAIDAVHGLCEDVELYNIHGYKWYDVDGDGERGEEELLGDWTIFLDLNENGALDAEEPSMQTANDGEHFGWYWFENLLGGTYQVCEIVPTDWQQTHPYFEHSVMCHTVTVPEPNEGDTCYANLTPNAVNSSSECNFGNRLAPDLSIEKSVLVNGQVSDTAAENDVLSYTITVTNSGDAAATNLYIEDTTPTNTTLVPNWGGDLGDPVDNLDGSFTWGPFGLEAGESVSVTFDVTVNAGLPIGVTNIENQATLYQASEEEENLEATNFLQKLFGIHEAKAAVLNLIAQSNIVLTTVTIAAPETPTVQTPGVVLGEEAAPGLLVVKTAGSSFANPGDTVTYTVTVTNNGDAVAENATIIDTLPDGLHFTDTVAMDHSWFLGDILDGESASISYDVVVDKNAVAGNYINTVVAWAADVDNVTDTATLEVREPAVLGAETLPVTGAGVATLVISTLAGLGAVALQNRKRM